ncbi:MAG: hypothetical protein J7503_11665 [Cellulomonas iranensis]|uniref:hypothetical protein n=1 Tax=Cellulomonas iranensis TaxID=76862 RepID=UPI001B2F1E9C|nr:hypothetical protein [Cellulomonas iranensis]MBO9569467.1 hypothetical protein [Cellulomonas iranensis]
MARIPISRLAPTDPDAYRRLRWRARAWTLAVAAVVVAVTTHILVLTSSTDEMTQKSAALVFLDGSLLVILLVPVLWFQWRRSFRARPQQLSVDDGDGTWTGVPELDEAPRPHLTLGAGEETPPRW